jgi:miniconductance mechanosensitive channel
MKYGMVESIAHILNIFILCAIITILAILANFIAKQIIHKAIKRWVDKSTNQYDDVFFEKGVFNKLSHLAPALIIAALAPIPLDEFPKLLNIVKIGANVYMLVMVLMVINAVVEALHDIYNMNPISKTRSIKGYIQMVKSIVYFVGFMMALSIIMNKDLGNLFAGLTAFAAVLMFVFKDAIMGLIAGIQMSSNDLLRVGDYIEMPNRGVDGTCIDIKLTTVKVHNTNRTIVTIPSYAFVSESFQNWRGLEMADSRRIRRFINIDLRTINFPDITILDNISKIDLLKEYVSSNKISEQTNLTIYRAYVSAYLNSLDTINKNNTFMIRGLQPTEHGLPLEIYVYCNEKVVAKYELIQSEIFEQLIAMMPKFGLKAFQEYSN